MNMLSLAAGNAGESVEFVDLGDSADVGSSSQVHLAGERNLDNFLGSLGHHLLNTGVHDVLLSGTLQEFVLVDGKTSGLVDDVQKIVLGLFLPLAGHSSGIHVLEVLQPLEIADSDSTSIAEDVRQESDTLGQADLLSFDGGGAIGSLHDDFALEEMGIVDVDGHFESGRDENVTE